MSHVHEKVVYSVCGCVHHQCRCIQGGQNIRTIPGLCPKCARLPAASVSDDTLTFAAAMALPVDVPLDWRVPPWGWAPFDRTRPYSCYELSSAEFRRSRPKRSRVEEMAEARCGKAPSDPDASYELGLDDAIRAVCEWLRGPGNTGIGGSYAQCVEREFLEPR